MSSGRVFHSFLYDFLTPSWEIITLLCKNLGVQFPLWWFWVRSGEEPQEIRENSLPIGNYRVWWWMKCFDSLRAKLISSYVVSRGIPPLAVLRKCKVSLFDFAVSRCFCTLLRQIWGFWFSEAICMLIRIGPYSF